MAAYATPLELLTKLDNVYSVREKELNDGASVQSGDEIDLENTEIVRDGVLAAVDPDISEDRSVKLEVGGSLVDPSDYEVDLTDGILYYSGTASGTAVASYKHADIPSSVLDAVLESSTQRIDNLTNTTFGGTVTVTDEVYSGTGYTDEEYVFDKRPVQSVDSVEVNQANFGNDDDYASMTEGSGDDYIVLDTLGVRFVDSDVAPDDRPYAMRVDYKYGYPDVPEDIKNLCIKFALEEMLKEAVVSANVKGRDDFDPETADLLDSSQEEVIEQYSIDRYSSADYFLDKEGSTS